MRYAVIDVETSNARFSSICQIGVAIFERREYVDGISLLVDPEDHFETYNTGIHGITASDVQGSLKFGQAWDQARSFVGDRILVHHTHFDRSATRAASLKNSIPEYDLPWLDSARVVRRVWPEFAARGFGLGNLSQHFDIEFKHHDALEDARATGLILARALSESSTDVSDWSTKLSLRNRSPSFTFSGSLDGVLAGEQIVFTGQLSRPRSEWSPIVAAAGAGVANSVSKRTTIVVVGEQDLSRLAGKDKSDKHLKAEALALAGGEIRIVGEADLVALLQGSDASGATNFD